MERNLCKEHGCPNACCLDLKFEIVVKEQDLLRIFPEAQKKGVFSFGSSNLPNGIYYFKTLLGDDAWVRIIGPCPRLEDGDCSVYNERLEPCKKFIKGSGECSMAWRERKRIARLIEVPHELG